MKNQFHSFALILGLSACALASAAAPVVKVSDSYSDKPDGFCDGLVTTTGSCSLTVSIPLPNIDLSLADNPATKLEVDFTDTYDVVNESMLHLLGDDAAYAGGTSFSVQETNADTGVLMGRTTANWTAKLLNINGTYAMDYMGGEIAFGTPGSPGTGRISDVLGVTITFGDFQTNYIVPISGQNKDLETTDCGTNAISLETGSFSGSADLTPLVVGITVPAANSKVYTPISQLKVNGTAKVNVPGDSLDSIYYYVNGGEYGTNLIAGALEGTSALNWSVDLILKDSLTARLGSNLVTVFAYDQFLDMSKPVSQTFYWVETNPASLRVFPSNAGTITGVKNGQMLNYGAGYKISAAPASSQWAFLGWTNANGISLANTATFNYIDSTNDGTLTAVFIPNPFLQVGGLYTGLFLDNNILDPNSTLEPSAVGPTNSGCIQGTVSKTGFFTGKLYLPSAGLPITLSGQFVLSPSNAVLYVPVAPVSKTNYLYAYMQLNTDTNLGHPGAGVMSGMVFEYNMAQSKAVWMAEISAERLLYNSNNTPPGQYNIAISPGFGPNTLYGPDPSNGPGGYSFMTATVSKTGAVAMSLHLADGVSPALSFSSAMARDGTCPFYASLYGGKGMILGWLQISNNMSAVQGMDVCWVKLPAPGKYYANGFAVSPSLSGALYVPPKTGTNLFGATALTFIVDTNYTAGISLPAQTSEPVTFNPARGVFTDTNKVSVTLTPSTGLLSGSFTPAGAKTATSFSGLVVGGGLPMGVCDGIGCYASTNHETGPFNLNDPANAFPFAVKPEPATP